MNKFLMILVSAYMQKVKAKAYIFTTLISVALIFLGFNFNIIIDMFNKSEEINTITVQAEPKLKVGFETLLPNNSETIKITEDSSNTLIIERDQHTLHSEVNTEAELSSDDKNAIQNTLDQLHQTLVMQENNITPEAIAELNTKTDLIVKTTSEEASQDGLGDINPANMVIMYVTLMLMFFIIIGYAGQVANDIAQEKSSRVIEMIVSSVSPTTHLVAKVSAIILSALTQILIFLISGYIAFKTSNINEAVKAFDLKFSSDTIPIIIICIIYLLLGLLLYLSLAAMLGSFVSRMEDLQQSIMPLSFLSIGGFYIAMFSIATPGTLLVKSASYFPFFTPYVMPLRMIDPDTTMSEQYIGIVIMTISIVLIIWLTTYIYKRSILLTEGSMVKSIKKIFNK
ncbi:ABC transporter permease [Phocicoccus pinnipedialis]|uniref:ABC-2 family transporter protein n=1 Tax=Phocicoccus pinnipedialis TaxID=110845 RepID=A0A6V7RAB8_9BACL|nr:ABC transporter permease [Jeotgalicoccus pinnipedialis]MBP1940185.1 ABC-2 type transport system permease protein [Jeotgalicoccus pinnipedialis]CAD2073908.1 ABC-2 family transporter protein [Jeotgalicoccus pinnipedialis]